MTLIEAARALRMAPVTIQRKLSAGLLKGTLRRDGLRGRGKWSITKKQIKNYLERYK